MGVFTIDTENYDVAKVQQRKLSLTVTEITIGEHNEVIFTLSEDCNAETGEHALAELDIRNLKDALHGPVVNGAEQEKTCEEERTKSRCSSCGKKWLVLVAGIFNLIISDGFPFYMSVLYVEFLDEFQRPKAETSLVQSVCSGVFLSTGVVSGILVGRFGEQKCMFAGGVLAATGLAVSYFATGIPFLVASIVTAGFGFSLIAIATYSTVPSYFKDSQKIMALGLLSLGPGIGSLLVPVILEELIEAFNWREALLMVSGIALNCCVSAVLSRNTKTKPKQLDTTSSIKDNKTSQTKVSEISAEETETKDSQNSSADKSRLQSFKDKFISVFSNKSFVLYLVVACMTFPPLVASVVFLIDFYEARGFTRETAVWLFLGMNIAGFSSRALAALLSQVKRIPKLAIPLGFCILGATAMFSFPSTRTVAESAIAACLFGSSLGGMVSVVPLVTLDLVGVETYVSAFATLTSIRGVANIIAGPLAGFHRDMTGTYVNTFYMGGGSLVCACLIMLGIVLYKTRSGKEKPPADVELEIKEKELRRRLSFSG